MSDLRSAVSDYLALRHSLGFALIDAGRLLPDFVGFLETRGATHLSTELALSWATRPANVQPIRWRQRLGAVRGFAQYLQHIDPDTEIPPPDLLPAAYSRITPYLYGEGDIARLMAAAQTLSPPLRATTYQTLIGPALGQRSATRGGHRARAR